jgi:DNA-binding GntR family transcriptional regulator
VKFPRIGIPGSLAERAYEVLKEAIISRQLAPHELLNEEQLAEQLGISRTPVRAALQKLEFEHLVRSIPGKGYMVASLIRADMEHVFFMRRLLEPEAARLAAAHCTPEDAAGLMENVAHQRDAMAAGEYLTYLKRDREFHFAIAAISKNPYLKTAIATVQLHGHRFLVLDETVRARTITSLDEHAAMVAAVADRDGERAARLTLEHIRRTEDMLASTLPVV